MNAPNSSALPYRNGRYRKATRARAIVISAVAAAIPFAAALIVGWCTGRITPGAWVRLGADRATQPMLFWLLVFFNAAMAAVLIYTCSTITG